MLACKMLHFIGQWRLLNISIIQVVNKFGMIIRCKINDVELKTVGGHGYSWGCTINRYSTTESKFEERISMIPWNMWLEFLEKRSPFIHIQSLIFWNFWFFLHTFELKLIIVDYSNFHVGFMKNFAKVEKNPFNLLPLLSLSFD